MARTPHAYRHRHRGVRTKAGFPRDLSIVNRRPDGRQRHVPVRDGDGDANSTHAVVPVRDGDGGPTRAKRNPQRRRREQSRLPETKPGEWRLATKFMINTRKAVKGAYREYPTTMTYEDLERAAVLDSTDAKCPGGQTFPNSTLPVINENATIHTSDGHLICVVAKGHLRRAFGPGLDAAAAGRRAHEAFNAIVPPINKKTDDRRLYFPGYGGDGRDPSRGVRHLAYWHMQSRGNSEKENAKHEDLAASISGDAFQKSDVRQRAVMAFTQGTMPAAQAVGVGLQAIDPKCFHTYKAQRDRLDRAHPFKHLLGDSDSMPFHGTATLVGLSCGPHRDANDVMGGWVGDTVFGDFEGGNMVLPQLGYQIKFEEGDVVYLRSRLVIHAIDRVTRGFRIGQVWFTHQSTIPGFRAVSDEAKDRYRAEAEKPRSRPRPRGARAGQ